jgi:hypothetical protein
LGERVGNRPLAAGFRIATNSVKLFIPHELDELFGEFERTKRREGGTHFSIDF